MKLAIIGTGNMGKALLKGFISTAYFDASDVNVCDVNKELVDKAVCDFGVNGYTEAERAVNGADYILMAVKPIHFNSTLKSIKDYIKDGAIVLSIAAAVTTSRIEGILGKKSKFVRVMPNTPAQVGAGVSAICPVRLDNEEVEIVKKLFYSCGEVVVCDENTLDAIGAVSGTGPAYVMLFIEAMADAAVSLGIKREDALKIAAATCYGSGKLCLESKVHPAVLKDQVCSPGGTTITGVMALEECGFRNAVIKSVLAADNKTKEMQKDK